MDENRNFGVSQINRFVSLLCFLGNLIEDVVK